MAKRYAEIEAAASAAETLTEKLEALKMPDVDEFRPLHHACDAAETLTEKLNELKMPDVDEFRPLHHACDAAETLVEKLSQLDDLLTPGFLNRLERAAAAAEKLDASHSR